MIQAMGRSLRGRLGNRIYIHSLEYFLADTCNLRCNHCTASSPFLNEINLPSLESFIESLSFLSRVMRAKQLKLLGGEPLLNKDICSFMRAARQSGMFRIIRVATNGLLLPKMSAEFWELADIIEISVYPATDGIFSEPKLESLRAMGSKYGTKLDVTRRTHFMEAISDKRIEDVSMVQQIFTTCDEAHGWSCHQLYQNRLYRCSRVHTLDQYLSKIGIEHENFTEQDGIVIDGRTNLLSDLKNYLKSSEPLKACTFCFGTSGPRVPHTQLTVPEIRAKSSHTPLAQ
jgi:organic radical activating enzyme